MPYNFPASLPVKTLDSEHPLYTERKEAIADISLLCEGGYKLRKQLSRYIKMRPGEHPLVYQARLDKFSYTNILASAITTQVGKLSKGSLTLSTASEAIEQERIRLEEMKLLSSVFGEVLKYQYCWLHVDKPFSEARTVAQEQMLGVQPYINLYSALDVINWGSDWIKLRRLRQIDNPLSEKPQYATEWIFIGPNTIATYTVPLIERSGELVPPAREATLESERPHLSPGKLPVVKFEVPDNLWSGNQALPLAVEHLKTSCHKADSEQFLYAQRQWNPFVKPNNDGFATIEDEDSFPKTGLEYLMRGDFSWVEPTGAILPHLEKSLERSEQQLRDIVSLGRVAYTAGNSASGVSKAYDEEGQEEVMSSYGQILRKGWQEVLSLVTGQPVELIGFDSFSSAIATRPTEVITLLSQPGLRENLIANVGQETAEKLLEQIV